MGNFPCPSLRRSQTQTTTADVDIAALRAQRDRAHRRVEELARAILNDGAGPAEAAATGELAELHNRHQQQRHHLHNLAHAHADWVHAEHTAETHRALLDQLAAHITDAEQRRKTDLAGMFCAYRDELARHTTDIDNAVAQTRRRLDAARAALLDIAGGVQGIVTERDIQARRAAAQRADIDGLTQARAEARDLDNRLARAESAAARAFAAAKSVAAHDELGAELAAVAAEVDFLAAAGARSPAAMYWVPEDALARLDADSRRAVIGIANSAQAIQPLRLHDGADKTSVLAGVAAAAHHHQHRILALPATEHAAGYATTNRYADTTTSPAAGRDNLEARRWRLPIGSLVIVDDADHLPPDQLRWLTDNAAATNTKLLLLTTPDQRTPAHTLTEVLAENLPWAHQLGTPTPHNIRATTALQRVEQHLTTTDTSPQRSEAEQLLSRRHQLRDCYRDLTIRANHDYAPHRIPDRDHGLEL